MHQKDNMSTLGSTVNTQRNVSTLGGGGGGGIVSTVVNWEGAT